MRKKLIILDSVGVGIFQNDQKYQCQALAYVWDKYTAQEDADRSDCRVRHL